MPLRPAVPALANRRHRRPATALLAVLAALALALGSVPAHAAPPGDTSGTAKGSEPTARWWQVALATGDLDFFETDYCRTVDLPSGPVVMLAGTFGGDSGLRECTVPAGATLVLPVVNAAYFLTDEGDTVSLGRAEAAGFLQGATVSATLDGQQVRVQRKRSSQFWVRGDALGVDGRLRTVSDGYWVVLRDLAPGTYELRSSGSVPVLDDDGEAATFTTTTTYVLTIR